MSEKKTKKKLAWQQYAIMVIWLLIGALCGFFMVSYIDEIMVDAADNSSGGVILFYLGSILVIYLALFIQLIIHEAGHLVLGLLTGYKFSSFRIMSFMWVKENGKVKFRRLSIAGTCGQCLMSPPDLVDGRIPVLWYNLGGSLMNVISGVIFLSLYVVFSGVPFLSIVMIIFALVGFGLAFINGVPMRMGTVDNDGYNAFALTRNREALRAFWVQLKVNEQTAKGVRLKDMPDDWFTVPSDEEMRNSMVAALGAFACSRLVDSKKFEEAENLMLHLLSINSGIVGLHRNLMICDRMYIELITKNRKNTLDGMRNKEQMKFMKAMQNFPTVLRTEYVYALLHEKDEKKASKIKDRFEKCAGKYPYPSDIQSERELMELAEGGYIAYKIVE